MIILGWRSWVQIHILKLVTEPYPYYHCSVTNIWDSSTPPKKVFKNLTYWSPFFKGFLKSLADVKESLLD